MKSQLPHRKEMKYRCDVPLSESQGGQCLGERGACVEAKEGLMRSCMCISKAVFLVFKKKEHKSTKCKYSVIEVLDSCGF